MKDANEFNSTPRWAFTRWLVETGGDVPPDIRSSLVRGLYGTIPIFIGGVLNTVAVSSLIAFRNPTPLFILWAVLEIGIAILRLPVLVAGRRAVAAGRPGPTDLYLLLGVLWAASVGYGAIISILSGDWVAATLACLSAAAMVGGICFRNYGAPRLVAVMIVCSLGPVTVGGLLSGEPILLVTAFQIPLYVFAMTAAAYQLNAMLVRTMRAERENGYRARHDVLTGLLNRAGLEQEIAEGTTQRTTLFYLDLDGFKTVNDSLGHGAGDRLLAAVGERLRSLVRPEDVVARFGGDEFVVLSDHRGRGTAFRTGERIVQGLSEEPYLLGAEAVKVGACIGIAMRPEHGEDFETLLAAADAALYAAKSSGRARCAFAPFPSLRLASGGEGAALGVKAG